MTDSSPGRARGNPAPRPALARFRPQDADDPAVRDAAPLAADDTAPSAAAAPGGTEGRDLLIPGRRSTSGTTAKDRQPSRGGAGNGRGVPSLADLMPPAAPSGRRHSGSGHGHGHGAATPAAKPKASRPAKAGKQGKEGKDGKDDKTVELSVPLPRSVRKQLKARAGELGLSPEEAVAQLVQVWLEG